jgi:hypothetical protein
LALITGWLAKNFQSGKVIFLTAKTNKNNLKVVRLKNITANSLVLAKKNFLLPKKLQMVPPNLDAKTQIEV